jgi:hypothetical protein
MVSIIPKEGLTGRTHDWQTRSPVIMHELRCELAETLELALPSAWAEIIEGAIARHGGSLIPRGRDNWGPHWWQVSVLGVEGTGETLEEAAREWSRCARRLRTAMEEAA